MTKTDLKNYAKLIVRKGANVQKGQDVVIQCEVSNHEFASLVQEEAYKAGARSVTIDWGYQKSTLLKYKHESTKTLCEIPNWAIEKIKHRVEILPAMIYIDGSDPDGLSKIDQDKLMKVRKETGPIFKKYSDEMDNKYQWTIVAIPHPKWAKKVFPNETKTNAMKKLWDAILTTTRVYGDPMKNWDEHNQDIINHSAKLNELKIKKLTYKNALGTDFEIELFAKTEFKGGGDRTLSGVFFNPNMPTEETFTSPNPKSANGVVMASKPLSVNGKVVSNFGFKFKDGVVQEVISNNQEDKKVLENLISIDEGAKRLGEVALVPFDSPINQTGLLFYNTLFDENACCHLALGRAFDDTITGYEKMTKEEIKEIGLNDSMIHVDFMIGTSDLSIVAETYDGTIIQVFKDGNWAI